MNYKDIAISIIWTFDLSQILKQLRIKGDDSSNLIELNAFIPYKDKNKKNTIYSIKISTLRMNNSEIDKLKVLEHSKLLSTLYDNDLSKEFDIRFHLKDKIEYIAKLSCFYL